MLNRLIIACLSFGLFSCTTVKRVSIDILKPADINFPVTTEKITVLNNAPFFSVDTSGSRLMNMLTEDELYIIDTTAIINLFNGFFSIVNESPDSILRNSEYIELRSDDELLIPVPLAEESVLAFSEDNNSDALISMEYFDLDLEFSFENMYSYGYGNYVQAELQLQRKNLWRVYDKTGLIIHEYFLNDTLVWTEAAYDRDEVYNLPFVTDAVSYAFYDAGQLFAKKISPYWETTNRVYYTIRERDGNYSLNKEHLERLSQHKNNKKAYKAAFNLAYLSEKEDDLRSALRWLEIAEFKNPDSPYADTYKRIIEARISMSSRLK
jgi:hypothetical protein